MSYTAKDGTHPVNGIPWIIPPHRVKLPTHAQLPQIGFHAPFIMPGRDPKDPRDCAVYAATGEHPLIPDDYVGWPGAYPGMCADCGAGPFVK